MSIVHHRTRCDARSAMERIALSKRSRSKRSRSRRATRGRWTAPVTEASTVREEHTRTLAYEGPFLHRTAGPGASRTFGSPLTRMPLARWHCDVAAATTRIWTPEDMRMLRTKASLFGLAAASTAPVFYASWIRPRMRSWGATQAETTRTFPGDELIPEPNGGATMGMTLPARPEKVWPWLVQMGRRPGRLVQLGLGGQRRRAERGSDRARMAGPGSGAASPAAAQKPDELVDRRDSGTEPHPGVAVELRLVRPILRSANRSGALGFHGGDLGFLPERGAQGSNPFGGPYAEP